MAGGHARGGTGRGRSSKALETELPPQTKHPDLYGVLGLQRTCLLEEVKRAYRTKALQCHPDKNPSPEAAEQFKQVSFAYSLLSDPVKRDYYDKHGDEALDNMDMQPEDFMGMFQSMFAEMMGGAKGIKRMLRGMSKRELSQLPPFPFPRELFPQGTFPEGVRFSSSGLSGMPPQVEAMLSDLGCDMSSSAGDDQLFLEMMSGAGLMGGPRKRGAPCSRTQPHTSDLGSLNLFGSAPFADLREDGSDSDWTTASDSDEVDDTSNSQAGYHTVSQAESAHTPEEGPGSSLASAGLPLSPAQSGPGSEPQRAQASTQHTQHASHSQQTGGAGHTAPPMRPVPVQRPPILRAQQQSQMPSASVSQPPRPGGTPPANSLQPTLVRDWMTAARLCDLGLMCQLFAHCPQLLAVKGAGLGHTALHWCAARGGTEALLWLLSKGAPVAALNTEGSTPLQAAARNGQLETTQILLATGAAEPGARDEDGQTAADLALQYGHAHLAQLLSRTTAATLTALPDTVLPPLPPPSAPISAPTITLLPVAPTPAPVLSPLSSTVVQHVDGSHVQSNGATLPSRHTVGLPTHHREWLHSAAESQHVDSSLGPPPQPTLTHVDQESTQTVAEVPSLLAPSPLQATQQQDTFTIGTALFPALDMPQMSATNIVQDAGIQGHGPSVLCDSVQQQSDTAVDPWPAHSAEVITVPLEAAIVCDLVQPAGMLASGTRASGLDTSEAAEIIPGAQPRQAGVAGSMEAKQQQQQQVQGTTGTGITLAEARAARRAMLLAASAAADEEEDRVNAHRERTAAASAAAVGVEPEQGRGWLEAAREGLLGTLQRLLVSNPALLLYKGQGTSLAFSGHSALHWASARGHAPCVAWLLLQGCPAGLPNAAGATPLHTAVENGQAGIARVLMLQGGADLQCVDELGETPRDVALRAGTEGEPFLRQLDLLARVAALRATPPASWSIRSLRQVLAAANISTEGALYKQELMALAHQLLASYSEPHLQGPGQPGAAQEQGTHLATATLPAPAACSAPSALASKPESSRGVTRAQPQRGQRPGRDQSDSDQRPGQLEPNVNSSSHAASVPYVTGHSSDSGGHSSQQGSGHVGGSGATHPASRSHAHDRVEGDPRSKDKAPLTQRSPPDCSADQCSQGSSEGEAEGEENGGKWTQAREGGSGWQRQQEQLEIIDMARVMGNDAFGEGNYQKAITSYTMAIRLSPQPSAVLHSNRAAAFAGMGQFSKSLGDADEAVRLAPEMAKAHGRRGTALLGLSRWSESAHAWQDVLRLDPTSNAARLGLQQAEASGQSQACPS